MPRNPFLRAAHPNNQDAAEEVKKGVAVERMLLTCYFI
jgi:hypothetical protein